MGFGCAVVDCRRANVVDRAGDLASCWIDAGFEASGMNSTIGGAGGDFDAGSGAVVGDRLILSSICAIESCHDDSYYCCGSATFGAGAGAGAGGG